MRLSSSLSEASADASSDRLFRTADGVEMACSQWLGWHSAAVLVVPGMLMTRRCRDHQVLAEHLASVADVFTVDARGHGDSGGRISFGTREPADVADLARWLRQRYDTVIGLGFSLGGYHVLAAEAGHHVFDAIAIAGTPVRLRVLDRRSAARTLLRSIQMMVRRGRGWHRFSLESLRNRPPSALALIESVAPTRPLIVHGGEDWLVPPQHAHLLYTRALEPKELAIVPAGRPAESLITEDSGAFLWRLTLFVEGAVKLTRSTHRGRGRSSA